MFVQGDYIVEVESGNTGWWNSTSPALRVALADAPDAVVTETELSGPALCGATVRDGKLYLAQADAPGYGPIPLMMAASAAIGSGTSTKLTVSVYDLAALPKLSLIGGTTISIAPLGWTSSFDALWPLPGVLVWATNSRANFYWGGPIVALAASTSAISSAAIAPWWWGGSSDARLFPFDCTAPASPRYLREVRYAKDAWSVGTAFAGDGAIFASHAGAHPDVTGSATASSALPRRWRQGWFLDVIDFTNPSTPVVRDPISLPSQLIGVALASPQGAILYSTGAHADSRDPARYLDAAAYDGISAALLGSVWLGSSTTPALVDGSSVFVGRTALSGSGGEIATFTLAASGSLTRVGSTALPEVPWSLHATRDILATQISDGIRTYDKSRPAALSLLGDDLGASLNGNLEFSDGDAACGLWLPLDDYGVEFIESGK